MTSKTGDQTKLPITKPLFDNTEIELITEVLKSGWVVQGPKVAEFERLIAEFTGAKHAIATTSCTTALHLALVAAGIGPGDEVLLPSLTYVASANAIKYVGAMPVFVDVDPRTFTIGPHRLASIVRDRTGSGKLKAIMPVSLFGLCCDMNRINDLAKQNDLIVIEDAACGLGGYRQGHHAGREALAGCFSFHPRKAITTGEGGMIITDSQQLADLARSLRDHGASKSDLERHFQAGGSLLPEFNQLGFNYRLTDIQGALGVAQMGKLEAILAERGRLAASYDTLLADQKDIVTPCKPSEYQHGYQSYVCLFRPPTDMNAPSAWNDIQASNKARNRLMASLEAEGISVRQGTHAVHTLGYYQASYRLADTDFPVSYMVDRLSITLPLFPGMTESDQQRVVKSIDRLAASL